MSTNEARAKVLHAIDIADSITGAPRNSSEWNKHLSAALAPLSVQDALNLF